MLSQLDPDKKIEWLMLDLNKLKTKLNSENAKELNQINGVLNPELTADLKQLWQNTTLVKIDKFLGKEKINNTFLTERGTVKRKQPKAIFEKIFLFRITPITDISECYRITPL
jgi:hypothetical protein